MKNYRSSAMALYPTILSSSDMPPSSQSQLPLYYLFSSAAEPFCRLPGLCQPWEGLSDATYAWPPRFSVL